MEKEDLNLPLVQVSGSEKGVNLLTAHGSKGLEFEHVFFAGCNASSWEKKGSRAGGIVFQIPYSSLSQNNQKRKNYADYFMWHSQEQN